MLNKTFCITCGEFIIPKVKEVDCTCVLNGVCVEYKELIGRCINCQNEVYSPMINDANVDRRLKAKQKCMDILKEENK